MANIYIDLSTGNDTTGDGSNTLPYLTINKGVSVAVDGDEIRVGKTTAPSTISVSNTTWTNNSATISTASTHVGTISVGDYIGKPSAAGNGALETYWRVSAINSSTITLETRYHGTTETIASFRKLNPVTTGTAGQTAATISKAITVSGGWTLSTQLQDSETWFKSNNLRSVDAAGVFVSSIGVTIDKLNIVETYRSIRITGTSCTLTNCSTGGSTVYNIELAGASPTVSNVRCTGLLNSSTYGFYINNSGSPCTLSDIKVSGFYGAQFAATAARASYSGFKAYNCSVAGIVVASGNDLVDAEAEGCAIGISHVAGGGNMRIIGGTLTNNATGISFSSIMGSVVDGVTITGSTTYGISFVTSHAILVRNCTFLNNTIDYNLDTYTATCVCINNSHTTPTTWAYAKPAANGSPLFISSCTIDAPSQAKAFQQIATTSNFISPQYLIQNSFNGLSGAYFANSQAVLDATTTPYSLKVNLNSIATSAITEVRMGACFAKQGVAKQIGYKIKANGVWSGTITPLLKLNGKTIVTGSNITSVTNGSYDTHTLSATALEIDSDGELALDFVYAGNTVAINLKEFSVTNI